MNDDFDKRLVEKIKEVIETDLKPYDPKAWEKLRSRISMGTKVLSFWKSPRAIAATILLLIIGGVSGTYLSIVSRENETNVNDGKHFSTGQLKDNSQGSVLREGHRPSISQESSQHKSKFDRKLIVSEIVDTLKSEIVTKTIGSVKDDEIKRKELISNNTTKLETDRESPLDSPHHGLKSLPLEKQATQKAKNAEVVFGLSFLPLVSYDQVDRNPRFGMGGGVFSEIPITRDITIHSGVFVLGQRIRFQENQLAIVTTGRQVKSKEAILYAIDLPFNVKYNFSISNYNFFIATGFSSTAYLFETVETIYQVSTLITALSVDKDGNPIILTTTKNTLESEVVSREPFQTFFFAKILNLSFGIKFPFENKGRLLVIEPFFKYSLGPQTENKIHPSSLGISCGIIF